MVETIKRVELPLPFYPRSINAYLIPARNGWILIDCGLNDAATLEAYAQAGVEWREIEQTLLTHVHPDHSGLAARIREWSGKPVRMHAREAETLRRLQRPEAWLAGQDQVLRKAGVPPSMRVSIAAASLQMRAHFPAMIPDGVIEDGEVIETALGPMEALLTPGHSVGHICFYLRDQRVLLAGDHLLKARTPHLEWHPETSVLESYVESLRRLAALDVEWVLPSHGNPFGGHDIRIAFLLRECERRLARLHEVRSKQSVHEMTLALWDRPMRAFEHRCAVMETLAYLQAA